MTDVFTKEKRSWVMSRIRSKNTKLELNFRKLLWERRLRYRIYYKIPGKPDIVFPKNRLVIFIDGDFWHGWNWHQLKPKLKNDFWINKIKTNVKRDTKVNKILGKMGWRVIRFWEHEIKINPKKCVEYVIERLGNEKD